MNEVLFALVVIAVEASADLSRLLRRRLFLSQLAAPGAEAQIRPSSLRGPLLNGRGFAPISYSESVAAITAASTFSTLSTLSALSPLPCQLAK